MSIKRLKSRGSPPWGCTLMGYAFCDNPMSMNFVVRFFTPNTQTEVAKAVAPAIYQKIHKANDTTNSIASANATDQATLNTLLNEIKLDYNAHRVSVTFHNIADATNAVTSADASNEATSVTLANEIKLDYNAHRIQTNAHPYNDYYNVVTTADCTNLATAKTLANEIKGDYNGHRTITDGMYFTVYGIVPGTYDVGIKNDGCMSILAQDLVFTPGTPIWKNYGQVYIGDITGDDYCDSGDAYMVAYNSSVHPSGDCVGYSGDWLVTDINTFGTWTVIPTARRKTY